MGKALQEFIQELESERTFATNQHWYKECYICQRLMERGFSHFALCPTCDALNTMKREQASSIDDSLRGRVAIVTGGRIGIGFATALVLLRKGATVITTTRFPADAIQRYNNEEDCSSWKDHLMIYGIDFRNLAATDRFIQWVRDTVSHIDILINNAAQTIAHSDAYYRKLIEADIRATSQLSNQDKAMICNELTGLDLIVSPPLPTHASTPFVPHQAVYETSNYIDPETAHSNSWSLHVQDVTLREMLEVQLVNVTTPFMFISQLLPMFRESPFGDRYIINVSAREGCFSKQKTEGLHPHTNMAKASLNMLTQTIAEDYARYGIYVNSVDPGWVSDQCAQNWVNRRIKDGFRCPLSPLDGASRVCAPFLDIIYGAAGHSPIYGQFLKDYTSKSW